METFLGVSGFDNVFEAVQKSWASQFTHTAVQYKRQNGQILNPGMAVVIQEMVASKTSGVMFTQDPVSGNPAVISITANYGLGESVVSAACDPDTFLLSKVKSGVVITQQIIGEKNIKIEMIDGGGTAEIPVKADEASKNCLSEDQVKQLGKLGLLVEESFDGPRDIEWAIVRDIVYLLQSRPVTSLSVENELVLTHEFDDAIMSKFEYSTKANVGEVFPGAISPLTVSVSLHTLDISFQSELIEREKHRRQYQYSPFSPLMLKISHGQLTLNVLNIFHLNNTKIENKHMTKASQLNVFGHAVEDENFRKRGIQRFGCISTFEGLRLVASLLLPVFKIGSQIKTVGRNYHQLNLRPDAYNNASSLYEIILEKIPFLMQNTGLHSMASSFSSMMSIFFISTIAGSNEEWPPEASLDFSDALGSCGDLESAGVPFMIEELVETIASVTSWKEFAAKPLEEATEWLLLDSSIAGQKFKNFLRIHGHRCIKEFDVHSISWGMEPARLVKTIQRMQPRDGSKKVTKKSNFGIEDIRTPLSKNQKRFLNFLLPKLRSSVGMRETSKSMLIRTVNLFRIAFRRLGKLLVLEGRIPEAELLFFLTLEEVGQLLKSRSPRLLSKAFRRMKIYPKLENIEMDEIMEWIPRPTNTTENLDLLANADGVSVSGTPMCGGTVLSTARVISKLEDATAIQKGDILITRSTDIAWSPYFPLLGGIVTELGGTISHGAVVAREYGLPCLIGAKGATKVFKSGDRVVLDSSKGIIRKVETG